MDLLIFNFCISQTFSFMVQLMLEQHGYELCRFIYMEIFFFFPVVNTTLLHHPWLVKPVDVEPWIQKLAISYM